MGAAVGSSLGLTATTYASYFLFYTAYDKGSRTQKPDLLADVLLARKGLFHTNRQVNKVLALAGLTLASFAALPAWMPLAEARAGLARPALLSLGAHFFYSWYSFLKLSPTWFANGGAKKSTHTYEAAALRMGAAGLSLMIADSVCQRDALAGAKWFLPGSLALGLGHFYFIETPDGTPQALPVRPWGYLAFYAPLLALGFSTWR